MSAHGNQAIRLAEEAPTDGEATHIQARNGEFPNAEPRISNCKSRRVYSGKAESERSQKMHK